MKIVEFDENMNQIEEKDLSIDTKIKAKIIEFVIEEFKKNILKGEECQVFVEEVEENKLHVGIFGSMGFQTFSIIYNPNGAIPKIEHVEML